MFMRDKNTIQENNNKKTNKNAQQQLHLLYHEFCINLKTYQSEGFWLFSNV